MKAFARRLAALTMALLLCLNAFSAVSWAAQETEVRNPAITLASGKKAAVIVDKVKAKAGETVKVNVKISSNPGIAGLAFQFKLAKGLTLKSIKAGSVLKDGVFTQNGNIVSWYAGDNVKKDGTLCTLTVKAPKDAGSYSIKAALKDGKASNLCDQDGNTVKVSFTAGTVTVGGGSAKLSGTTLSSVKAAKGRKLAVIWKRNTAGKGYELQYSTDKSFQKAKKTLRISRSAVTSATLTGLKKGKTYYVRIRTVSGKIVSGWSGVKKAKVKQ